MRIASEWAGIKPGNGMILWICVWVLAMGSGRMMAQQTGATAPAAAQETKPEISAKERSYLDYEKQEEELRRTDWPNLKRFHDEDEKLGENAVRVHGFCLPGRANDVRNTCTPLPQVWSYNEVYCL